MFPGPVEAAVTEGPESSLPAWPWQPEPLPHRSPRRPPSYSSLWGSGGTSNGMVIHRLHWQTRGYFVGTMEL